MVTRWLTLTCSSLVLGVCLPAFAETANSTGVADGKWVVRDAVATAAAATDTTPPPGLVVALEEPAKTFSPTDGGASASLQDPVPDLVASDIPEDAEASMAPAIAQQPEATDSAPSNRWSIQAEALFLDRDIPDVVTTVDRANGDRYGTDDLSFDLDPGIRWNLSYRLTAADSLELGGFGLINHEDQEGFTSSILSPGGEVLRAAFNPDALDPSASNFAQAFRQTIHYSAATTNLELNYRRTLPRSSGGWQGSLLAGVRYLSLSEDFQLSSIDEDPAIFPTTSVGRYAIDADNDAIGLQVGGDLSYQFARDFDIGLRLRTGLLLNSGRQDSEIRNDLGGQIVTTRGDGSNTEISPVLEVGAFLNWALSRRVSLSAGYSLMVFGNMVLAPDQFASNSNFSDSLSGLDRGTVVYHGPSLGIQVRF